MGFPLKDELKIKNGVSLPSDGLPLTPKLATLVPGGHLRPGGSIGVTGKAGRTSLLLQLLVGPMAHGCWTAVVGLPELGAQAGVEGGVALNQLALIPKPGDQWLDVTAALLDSVELVVLNPPHRCKPTEARRLLARARQRRSVLILVDGFGSPQAIGMSASHQRASSNWPEQPDLIFDAHGHRWYGVADGHGSLRSQRIEVSAYGRRLGGRTRETELITAADPATAATATATAPLISSQLPFETTLLHAQAS